MRIHGMKSLRDLSIALAAFLTLTGCGYNKLQGLDEEVKGTWGEVQNQYQRRADLVPNLVSTVKGAANFEQETLQKVIEARSAATSIKVDANALKQPGDFQEIRTSAKSVIRRPSRLIVVVEKYPDLKANQNFQNLQAQLEGTENRIAVARKRYIESVAEYNKAVRFFPTNLTAKWLLGLEVRPTFSADEASQKPPAVKF